ncbi:1265_t:CDS:2 [Cetraspora pellucida]|uniref:1265_t:CDS:1 n=1 Tax=Cetraspora pellucida TaxID=1433469 RepID=A0A9N9HHB1_9GLOM|nr:1265_t:CDS:2 [Cetraspora pellucida]
MYKRNISSIVLLSFLVLFYFAFLTTYVQSVSCGPYAGNSSCLTGLCCSKDGFCGKTDLFCGEGCDPKYGVCGEVIISGSATTVIPSPTSPTKLSEASGPKKNSLGILFLVVLVAVVLL